MKETNEAIQEVLNLSEELTHHKHGKRLIILGWGQGGIW